MVFILIGKGSAEARFASQFSLSAGEQYTDNVFFSEPKQYDFITVITPTLGLIYQPSSTSASKFTADLNVPAEIFARHSALNNIGDQLSLRSRLDYPYSRRLSFELTDCLGRLGKARNGEFGNTQGGGFGGTGSLGNFSGRGNSGGCGGSGGFGEGGLLSRGNQSSLNEAGLITTGETIENSFDANGQFLYTPNLTFRSLYQWRYLAFIDAGGKEMSHAGAIEGRYSGWLHQNLSARFTLEYIKSRNGDTNLVPNIDIGDDFISSRKIQLTPTLTLSVSNGIGLLTQSKFPIKHNLNVSLMKLWQRATFQTDVRRGITGSYGASGPSYTTSFFSNFTILLTRRLNMFASVGYSMFDTDQGNFNTFIAGAGIRYNIFYWLSVNLAYTYRRANPEGGSLNSTSSLQGKTDSNAVFIMFSAAFDIWPHLGLGRGQYGIQAFPAAPPGGALSPSPPMLTP